VKTKIIKSVCIACLILLALHLSGCNTWEGFGKDMSGAGEDIQEEGAQK